VPALVWNQLATSRRCHWNAILRSSAWIFIRSGDAR